MKYKIKLLNTDECADYAKNYKDKIDIDNKYTVMYYIKYMKNNGEYKLFENGSFYTFYETDMIYIPTVAIIKWIIEKTTKEAAFKFGKKDTKGVII